jgi:hypothetical protein
MRWFVVMAPTLGAAAPRHIGPRSLRSAANSPKTRD